MIKQKGTILLIMLSAFTYASGQDKIITTQKDTIYCKIVSVSLKFMKYEQEDFNQATTSRIIPMEQVKEYSLGPRSQRSSSAESNREHVTRPFQATRNEEQSVKPFNDFLNEQQAVMPVTRPKIQREKESFRRWRIGFQGGGSYLLNSLAPSRQAMKDLGVSPPEQADDYYKQLRRGIAGGADAYYLIGSRWGIGVKYSFFASSIRANYTVEDNGSDIPTYYNVYEKEQMYLNYLGPSVFLRQWLTGNHKFGLSEELSVGYILYRDKTQFDPYQYVFVNPETNVKQYNVLKEGNTYSGTFQLSLEYFPTQEISVGLSAGAVPVFLRSLKISDTGGTNNKKELGKTNQLNLSRIDVSLGIHFRF